MLGSHGRGELHCASDQDSGLVWAGQSAATSDYAARLAAAVIDALADWGLARCSGGFTADHWSHDLERWHELIKGWVWDPDPQAVVDTEVFLDFRPLCGDLDVDELSEAIHSGAESPRLLHGLAVAATSHPVPLSPFGRLRGRQLNAKRSGLSALVLIAHVFALRAGSRAIGTRQRLADARSAGVLGADLVDELQAAHHLLTSLRLRFQLEAISSGQAPDNEIALDELTKAERADLRHGLRAIRAAQQATQFVFRTEL